MERFLKKISKWKKKFGVILTIFLWLRGESTNLAAESCQIPEELKKLYARSAVLMDGDSGRVLFGKNQNEALPMASTTKILTCILALEQGNLQQLCEVSKRAEAQPKVHLGMREGEHYRLEDLLYSMMLESHNDSAVCVAETIAGSVEAFADQMNQKAEAIGCRQAHFITPNGLDGEDGGGTHRITAEELARILRYCVMVSEKKEEFLKITGTAQYQFQNAEGTREFFCRNHNALLTMMDGALTGKTGFTGAAGYCYAGAVQRGDRTLITALLACGWPEHREYKWADCRTLFAYGFANYEKKVWDLEELSLPAIPVLRGVQKQVTIMPAFLNGKEGNRIYGLALPGETLRAEIRIKKTLTAPVEPEQQAGMLRIYLGETMLREHPLVCKTGAEERSYWFCLKKVWENYVF